MGSYTVITITQDHTGEMEIATLIPLLKEYFRKLQRKYNSRNSIQLAISYTSLYQNCKISPKHLLYVIHEIISSDISKFKYIKLVLEEQIKTPIESKKYPNTHMPKY